MSNSRIRQINNLGWGTFSGFPGFSRSPFVRGYWPKNGKVGNESLPARSDLSTGELILWFYFDGNLRVLGLRGFFECVASLLYCTVLLYSKRAPVLGLRGFSVQPASSTVLYTVQ